VVSLDRYSDISEPGSPSAAASLDRSAAMASATLSSTAAAEGEPADDYGILPSLDLASFVGTEGTSQSVETEGSGPLGGVGPSVLGAVTSSDETRPPGPEMDADPVVCDPVVSDPGLEDHVREAVVPAGIEDADLGTANGPELTAVPETDDPLAESGQGLSPTPEGRPKVCRAGSRLSHRSPPTPPAVVTRLSATQRVRDDQSAGRRRLPEILVPSAAVLERTTSVHLSVLMTYLHWLVPRRWKLTTWSLTTSVTSSKQCTTATL